MSFRPAFLLVVFSLLFCSTAQPEKGPGGSDYLYDVRSSRYGLGSEQFWIFEPVGLESAPMVVFLHGWSAMSPEPYLLWIEHIVKKGRIVVYPRYQESLFTRTEEFTPNAIKGVRRAIAELESGAHTRPELDKVVIAGHSAGGIISVNMAIMAESEDLPFPRALMCVEPGITERNGRKVVPLLDPARLPDIPMLVVVGDADKNVGDMDAKKIFSTSRAGMKNYIVVRSDDHGDPALIADHYAPLAAREGWRGLPNVYNGVNALDYYGFWKLLDALCDFSFYGKNREYAFGNTPEQRFMGLWGDGVPVKELEVYEVL